MTTLLENGIEFKIAQPVYSLFDFVESFWMLKNTSGKSHETILVPDGRFDIIFSFADNEPFHAMFMGLTTKPEQITIPPHIIMFAISFKLPAIEYLLERKAGTIVDGASSLPNNYLGVVKNDLNDFEKFCNKITKKLLSTVKPDIDVRKMKLFELIYFTNGTMPVAELSEKVSWSSRQINRYFTEQFGIPLKTYCNILRFKTSLHHIKNGQLYPELDFTDQNHFIKQIKRYAGVSPKELAKNQNDRFILLSALPKE